jgi:hypothetical protein
VPYRGCAQTLDELLASLFFSCPLDATSARYSTCGGVIVVSWIEAYENEYDMAFDAETGVLIGGSASGYLGHDPCGPNTVSHYRAGTPPSSRCDPVCSLCAAGAGGEAGAATDDLPGCTSAILDRDAGSPG